MSAAFGPSSDPSVVVIANIRAVDPAAGLDEVVDAVVEDGRLSRLGRGAATPEVRSADDALVIDGAGRWLLPAFVDLHAHLREPGHEYKEDIASGLQAAAAGGYAHVCCMPNTHPVNDRRSITEALLARAEDVGGARLHPIAAATVGQQGRELTEMGDLKEAGAVAVSDDGRCVLSSAVMRRVLEYARTFELPVIQHAEDHSLTEGADMHEGAVSTRLGLRGWPREAEDIVVARDVALLEATGGRYHLAHASTEGAVHWVRTAKERGLSVTAEVTPHHLMLTHEAVAGYDTACKVNPPLRERRDVDALRAALADGTIDVIATDHAPHSSLEKECEFALAAPGMIGLELVVPVLLALVRDDVLPLGRFIDALTHAPSRIIGIAAPCLREGALAELCIVNPDRRHAIDSDRLRSKSRNSPFVGKTGVGWVELTMAGGSLVYHRELHERTVAA